MVATAQLGDDRFARQVLWDLERLGDDADRLLRDMNLRAELFDLDHLAELRRLKFAIRDLAKKARRRDDA